MPDVYVTDTDKKIIQLVSLEKGPVLSSPKFAETPSAMVLSPNGSRLLVLLRRAFRTFTDARRSDASTMRPTKSTLLTIINTADFKPIAEFEDVGWNAASIHSWPLATVNGL